MQTLAQIETIADEAMSRELNAYLDRRYPDGWEFAAAPEPDDTIERLKECAERCQQWLFAMKLAADLGQTEKAWQALEELECEANQMLERMP